MTVEYRDIPGYPGYQVGSDGSVLTLKTAGRHAAKQLREPRRLKTKIAPTRYPMVCLCRDNVKRYANVHTLVAEAFLGPRPWKNVVRHLDGDRTNCALENLAYGSAEQNEADKVEHGTRLCGEFIYGARLTEAKVLELRKAFASGRSAASLAVLFGVHEDTVLSAVHGDSWGHLPVPDYSGRKRDYANVCRGRDHWNWKHGRKAKASCQRVKQT